MALSPAANIHVAVAFLAIQQSHRQMQAIHLVAGNILHFAAGARVSFHVVADQPARPLQAALRGVAGRRQRRLWFAHSTRSAPDWVHRLHHRLVARGCRGPVCHAYMHKPLLHVYLPRTLQQAVFIDSDVMFFADVALLWRHFDFFSEDQLIGLAVEENAFGSQEPVVRLGGLSSNGGVELLHLQRMRSSGYNDLLWRYARRDARLPLNGNAGVVMQGEQVLYSWMSINGTPGHAYFYRLPCAWNRQVASWPSHVSSEDAAAPRRQCHGCNLLHGAGGEAKALMAELSRDPAARHCTTVFDRAQRRSRHYPPGSPSLALFLRVRTDCCRRPRQAGASLESQNGTTAVLRR